MMQRFYQGALRWTHTHVSCVLGVDMDEGTETVVSVSMVVAMAWMVKGWIGPDGSDQSVDR